MDEEIWKPVKDFDDYYISNFGRVKRIKNKQEQFLNIVTITRTKTTSRKITNFSVVHLSSSGRCYMKFVKVLVAESFLNFISAGKSNLIVRQIDGDYLNNYLNNLEIVTAKQNQEIIRRNKNYPHNLKIGSSEYKRMQYICKRDNITYHQYVSDPQKYNIRKTRRKHLQYEINTTEYRKAIWLSQNYGITLEEYNAILLSQNNVCAICGKVNIFNSKFTNKRMSLSVDHNHETGKIRGILCNNCNRAMGLFGDDTEILYKAINYLNINN